jgi:phage terminase large subunit
MTGRYQVVVDERAEGGYELRGGNRAVISCRDPELVVAGPADTGKTFACAIKLHLACLRYAGLQAGMVRKTFKSMSGTVSQRYANLAEHSVTVYGGETPSRFIYRNGSTVWVGGMDNPDKILSSERHLIYVNQAEELREGDWEVLSTRCSGRADRVFDPDGNPFPYSQLLGDCNPGGSKHWIRERAKVGKLTLIATTHFDNPTIYARQPDGSLALTEDGPDSGRKRMAVLDALTGVRYKRLRQGLWVTAEGAVYDNFDSTVHVRERDWRDFKTWYLAVDEGYTNPAVVLLVGVDADGRQHVAAEFYERGVLPEGHVLVASSWFKDPLTNALGLTVAEIGPGTAKPSCTTAAVDESAAGLIASLQARGVHAVGAKGRVLDGINCVQNLLKVRGDGRPRLTVDPGCVNTVNEFESYVWEPDRSKDTPVKEFDHCLDSLRYLQVVLGGGAEGRPFSDPSELGGMVGPMPGDMASWPEPERWETGVTMESL